ncbi:hypothetical protein N599_28270 [Saccharopolyspora erythraea D]|nr:hypothetical protein N599_28270 [Saccharopolyspora erythraea D]
MTAADRRTGRHPGAGQRVALAGMAAHVVVLGAC